jgi:hypothetical protein
MFLVLAGCCAEQPASQPGPLTTTGTPIAASAAPPETSVAPPTLALLLDDTGARLEGDAVVLVPLAADPSRGADVAFKRNGPNDLYLVPLAEALLREKNAGRIREPLRVIAKKSTVYRVLIEALFTAGQSEIGAFELCEESCDGRTFSFRPPRVHGDDRPPFDQRALNLRALIVTEGIAIKASGGNVARGCNVIGPGLAIPRRQAAHDLASLVACVTKLKASSSTFASEVGAVISANPHTPFHELMDVALALQGPEKNLFPELTLAVMK